MSKSVVTWCAPIVIQMSKEINNRQGLVGSILTSHAGYHLSSLHKKDSKKGGSEAKFEINFPLCQSTYSKYFKI